MAVEIFPAARNRLLEIWQYTATQWGEDQADKYTRDLISAIEEAAPQRSLWRKHPQLDAAGIYFIRHAHHYIFFRDFACGTLGVVSVLHEAMDIPSRLKDDELDFGNFPNCPSTTPKSSKRG
jgi:plasmid stabilization system protein ParE